MQVGTHVEYRSNKAIQTSFHLRIPRDCKSNFFFIFYTICSLFFFQSRRRRHGGSRHHTRSSRTSRHLTWRQRPGRAAVGRCRRTAVDQRPFGHGPKILFVSIQVLRHNTVTHHTDFILYSLAMSSIRELTRVRHTILYRVEGDYSRSYIFPFTRLTNTLQTNGKSQWVTLCIVNV